MARQAKSNEKAFSIAHLSENLSAHTARGSFITIATQPLRIILQFVATAILARLLSPADFGLVAMASAVTGFAALFADIGLGAATFRIDDLKQDTVSGLFFFNLMVGVGLLPVVWIAAPLSAEFFRDSRLTMLVLALSFSIPLSALGAQHTVLLLRTMRQLPLQLSGVAGHAAGALAGVIAAWGFHLGYWSMVVTAWVAPTVTTSLLWIVCPWRPTRVKEWTGALDALRVGLNVTGFSVLNYIHRQLDNVLLGWNVGSVELGYYSRAYQLMLMPLNVFGNSLTASIEPALSRLQGDPPRWRLALLDALAMTSFLGCGLAALLAVASRPLIFLLYGPQWDRAATMFQLLAVALFAGVPMNAVGWIYVSLGRTDRLLRWSLFFTPVLAVAFAVAAPRGGEAVALAYAIVMNAMLIPAFAYATHQTPVTLSDTLKTMLPMMVAGAIAAGVGFAVPVQTLPKLATLILSGAATGVVFLGLCSVLVLTLPRYAILRRRLTTMGMSALAAARQFRRRAAP
jgi:PST family polysaccharide transporter